MKPTETVKKKKAAPELVSERGKVTKKRAPAKPPAKVPPLRTPGETRQAIVAYWRWGVKNEKQIHYAQERPMERLHDHAGLERLPRNCDCSEFFTDGYAFAGGPDPNGEHYNGTGYTGTLISNGHEIPKGEAQAGDAVIFGISPGHHVVGVLEAGDDPLIVSHGQEKGPIEMRLSQESPYQPAPVRFYRYLPH